MLCVWTVAAGYPGAMGLFFFEVNSRAHTHTHTHAHAHTHVPTHARTDSLRVRPSLLGEKPRPWFLPVAAVMSRPV